jgi:hypothetical protein
MDWKDMIVTQSIATFLMWLKSLKGAKKAAAKKTVLKVYTTIRLAYADDEDFA